MNFYNCSTSEYIKSLNYDGVRFKSSVVKSGYNLTIFSYKKCKPISSDLYVLKGTEHQISSRTDLELESESERKSMSDEENEAYDWFFSNAVIYLKEREKKYRI